MRDIFDGYRKRQAIEKAEKIYAEIEEEDKRLAEVFLSICFEPVPKYKVLKRQ